MKKTMIILLMTSALCLGACSHQKCNSETCGSHPKSEIIQVKKTPAYFAFDSSVLTAEDRSNLDIIAKRLKANPTEKVIISGYTDNIGTEKYNITLSEHRAQSAADYLKHQGICAGRIQTKGYGATHFATGNKTSAERAKNRRIEVSFQ